jgi:single-strand DNA-binding protein
MESPLFRLSLTIALLATECSSFSLVKPPAPVSFASVATSRTTPTLFVGNFFDEIEDFPGDDEQSDDGYLSDEALEAAAGEWDPSIPQFNRVTLTGRVGNAPDPRYFDDGKVVLNLSLAVKRKYDGYERQERKIRSGEEETDWFGLEIWGRDAEYAAKFVTKGCRIGINGNLQVDRWEDKMTGELRQRVKVVVKDLDILETRAESELRQSGSRGGASFKSSSGYDDDYEEEDEEGFGSGYGSGSSAGPGGFFD